MTATSAAQDGHASDPTAGPEPDGAAPATDAAPADGAPPHGPSTSQAAATVTRARMRVGIPPRIRRVISKPRFDALLDRLRLHLDLFPRGLYQPVDVLPVRAATRADGSASRWAAMRPVVERLRVRSAIDVGANAGFFSLSLGRMGIPTLAVDNDPALVRTASFAVRRAQLANVGVAALALTPDTLELLAPVDCIVFLSVWHHFVFREGLGYGTALLEGLWARTRKVMFFDTGEDEMPEWFNLPEMQPDARTWLTEYLSALPGATVEFLGTHAAFDADGNPAQRNLFAVVRTDG